MCPRFMALSVDYTCISKCNKTEPLMTNFTQDIAHQRVIDDNEKVFILQYPENTIAW